MRSRYFVSFMWLWALWSVVSTVEYASGGTPSFVGFALGGVVAGGILLNGRTAGVDVTSLPTHAKPRLDPPRP